MKELIAFAPSWALAPLLVFVTVMISSCLQQASAASRPGWLSIDCGATAPYDDANGIHWVPDTDYIASGVSAPVTTPFNASNAFHTAQLASLRHFPNVSRACYTLPVNKSQPHLLRLIAYHGEYDHRSSFSFHFSFETYVGDRIAAEGEYLTKWVHWREVVFRVPQDEVRLCLHRDDGGGGGDAFVSALEVRPLQGSSVYGAAQDGVSVLYLAPDSRFDFGAEWSLVRYPQDVYDRYWPAAWAAVFTNVENFVGASSVRDSGLAIDEPPPAVMNTALTAMDNTPMTLDLVYKSQYATNGTKYLINFYFAELQSNISTGPPRVFNIIVDGVVKVPNFDVYSTAQNVLYKPVEVPIESMATSEKLSISLSPTPTSTLKPIINALEIYFEIIKKPGTESSDASAIEGVKKAFGLISWTGDPCWYRPYDWLVCSNASLTVSQQVTAMKLSNYNLTGTLPDSLGELTSLISLRLDNNKLTGPIPVWLVKLPNLRELDLRMNNFSGTIPEYDKTILDLRIDGNLNLCIPNATNACATGDGNAKKVSSSVYIIVGVVVGVVMIIGAGVALYFICSARKRKKQSLRLVSTVSTGAKKGSRYTLAQVLAATKNYSKLLGKGGFGPVYYGKLASGEEIAVKVASKGSSQGSEEFINEIELLTRIHHRNLVSLVGYCDENDNLMLLYEYVPSGTLQEHLYGKVKTEKELFLDWKTRLQIALGAAQGLEYLHVGCNPAIIHRDVKSSNILLDDKLIPKVADFGLSKSTNSTADVSHVSTQVKGTFGYIDPEYFISNQLTDKSDVYGFGIVLLELVCARPPYVPSLPEERRRIDDWVRPFQDSNQTDQIVDPALIGHYNTDSMSKVVHVAMKSLEPKGVHRPNMSTVVHELREAFHTETGSDSASASALNPLPHTPPHSSIDSSLLQSSNATSDVRFSSDSATKVLTEGI